MLQGARRALPYRRRETHVVWDASLVNSGSARKSFGNAVSRELRATGRHVVRDLGLGGAHAGSFPGSVRMHWRKRNPRTRSAIHCRIRRKRESALSSTRSVRVSRDARDSPRQCPQSFRQSDGKPPRNTAGTSVRRRTDIPAMDAEAQQSRHGRRTFTPETRPYVADLRPKASCARTRGWYAASGSVRSAARGWIQTPRASGSSECAVPGDVCGGSRCCR